MKRVFAATCIVGSLALSCCAVHRDAHAEPSVVLPVSTAGPSTSGKIMRLLVHSSEPHRAIPSAEVVATAGIGKAVALGETNEWGILDVEKATLREIQPTFIVICSEWYFCGAIPIDSETLETFDEQHIELARWTIH